MKKTRDITIIGAGPAGLSFARCLSKTGLQVAIIEKQSEEQLAAPEFDGRDIALTHQSVSILKELGIWSRFAPDDKAPIKEARVLDGTSPYALSFDSHNENVDVLGYLVSNHDIRKALFDEVQTLENVEIHAGLAVTSVATDNNKASIVLSDGQTMQSKLIVAADSRFSETRRMLGIAASMHDFGRVCIVCRVENEKPHDEIAFECFQYGRTLAILPLSGNRSSVVITAPASQRNEIMDMDEDLFNLDLQQRFGDRLGGMKLISERFAYPLVGVHAKRFFATRFALIGDAAVGMHPVTAHGFNLGLSGAQILANEITSANSRGADIGASPALERYETRHMQSTRPMYHGTNEIVKLFTDDRLAPKVVRQVALRLVNNFPPIKRAIQSKLTAANRKGSLLPPFFRLH